MAYHVTTPSYSAGSWDTEAAAVIEYVVKGPLDYFKLACPTLRLLMENQKVFDVGPDGKVGWNYIKSMYPMYVYKQNQVYPMPDIDPLTRLEFELVNWGSAFATNQTEVKRYQRQSRSLVDLAAEKMQLMHDGLTQNVNFLMYWDWNAADISGNTLDTETLLANAPLAPPTSIENVSVNTDLSYSIPMCIRDHVTGHTFGNVSSANAYWQATETNGVTPTKATTGNNIDAVTAIPSTVALGVSNIRTHLQKMQRGAGFRLYVPTPAELYGVLEDYILAERRRDANTAQEMVDLGLNSHFVYEEYNTVFFLENMMTDLWANSMFFWDLECLFLAFETDFNPFTSPLERLPHSNILGAATEFHSQLMAIARVGTGAMHCWASE
jgi:hypothetical protein